MKSIVLKKNAICVNQTHVSMGRNALGLDKIVTAASSHYASLILARTTASASILMKTTFNAYAHPNMAGKHAMVRHGRINC